MWTRFLSLACCALLSAGAAAAQPTPGETALLAEPEIQRIDELQVAPPGQGVGGVMNNVNALRAIPILIGRLKARLADSLKTCHATCPVRRQEYAALLRYEANHKAVVNASPLGKLLGIEERERPPEEVRYDSLMNDPWANPRAGATQAFDAIDPYCRARAGLPQRLEMTVRDPPFPPEKYAAYLQCGRAMGEIDSRDMVERYQNIVHAHRMALATCAAKYRPSDPPSEQQPYVTCMNSHDPYAQACAKYRALRPDAEPCEVPPPTASDLNHLKTFH